ncbi:MAG TPA: 5'/3'-nucleotidase SurE [Polyangiaceae bacterium]|jgi:5'-nucleotidase
MLILLANDDGFGRRGIRAMQAALAAMGEVIIVAPELEQSATSHSLSLHRPLRVRKVEERVYAIDGTPADCIYVALHHPKILPHRPDLVVSGLNHGLNLGQDVFYSGTVAAAREAALRGIPAIAASAARGVDRELACGAIAELAKRLLAAKKPMLLNVNFPPNWAGAMRVARVGFRAYEELVDLRKDPRGRDYLWIGGSGVHHDPDPGSDTAAHDEGVASVTPLRLDLTAEAELERAAELI